MEKRILFIQPFDRPWMNYEFSAFRKKLQIPRAVFEVGQRIPAKYSVDFLDVNLRAKQQPNWTIQKIVVDAMKNFQPDLILLAFPTYAQGAQVEQIILMAKEINPAVKIILGGATLNLIEDAPKKRWGWPVDACYWGNGTGISQLIEDVLVAELGCSLMKSDPVGPLVDDYSPENFYTIGGRFDFDGYLMEIKNAGLLPRAIVEMIRGCNSSCNYCAFGLMSFARKSRKSLTVLQEICYLAQKGIDYILIIDPTFGMMGEATEELLQGMTVLHTEQPGIQFDVMTCPEYVKPVFAEKLKASGVVLCGIGMETMSQAGLDLLSKSSKPTKVYEAVLNLAKAGIRVRLFHMLLPGKFLQETIEFLLELTNLNIDFVVQSSFLRPLPDPKSQEPFWMQDRTIFNPKGDTVEQVMEYLLANLVFPSIDLPFNDLNLRKIIGEAIVDKRDLRTLFSQSEEGGKIILKIGDYIFTENSHDSMWLCIKTGGVVDERNE